MADTVSTVTIYNSPRRLVIKFLNRSDGTGESNVVKVDKSAYTGLNGLEPSCFMLERVDYDVQGMEVQISVDATTDVVLERLEGYGTIDYTQDRKFPGLSTRATGDTGDILFSTNGHSAGDHYDITLYLRKKD